MKKLVSTIMFLAVIIAIAAITAPASAFANTWKPFNNSFIPWQERDDVVHIFEFDDVGTTGQPVAVVSRGRPFLVGFELSEATVAELQANYIDNPDHNIYWSLNGGPQIAVKDWYQPPFEAATGSGPAWSWDHDNDGSGDGDGDGIGDWNGPVMFFRIMHQGNSTPGTYTYTYSLTNDGGATFYAIDTVTFLVE